MTRPTGKCSRPNCDNIVQRNGLCVKHNRVAPHGYMPSQPAREHVQQLRACGHTAPTIAHQTGLAAQTITNIETGRHQRLQRHAYEAVMRTPLQPPALRIYDLIPAVGTRRRIHALCAIGWTQSAIAHEYNVPVQNIHLLTQKTVVTVRWATRIATLYERLSMTPGPSTQIRARARRLGWAPPLAWDEGCIDDPAAKPNLGRKPRTKATNWSQP
jgi:hypothetical protein